MCLRDRRSGASVGLRAEYRGHPEIIGRRARNAVDIDLIELVRPDERHDHREKGDDREDDHGGDRRFVRKQAAACILPQAAALDFARRGSGAVMLAISRILPSGRAPIDHVGHEVECDDERGVENHDAHHQRVVALQGAVDEVAPDSRQAVNLFHN